MRRSFHFQRTIPLLVALLAAGGLTAAAPARGAGLQPGAVRAVAQRAGLDSLARVPRPTFPGLTEYVNDAPAARTALTQLGKALFWDMQVGSDGQACASCHFHAGADNRVKNQVSPGLNAGDVTFSIGPNSTLQPGDFPFHRVAQPTDQRFGNRTVVSDTNDVVSSAGVSNGTFTGMVAGAAGDIGTAVPDPVFNVGGVNTRRVEPRNTPTMINAVFNVANFWDGRAHPDFNGSSPFGPLDSTAGVFVPQNGTLVKQPVVLGQSSLASQAVGPPLSDKEMSFAGRTYPLLGRKMLSLRPLALQSVHPDDSVLGPLSRSQLSGNVVTGDKGLATSTYAALVQQAFRPKYWNSTAQTNGFTQMEANFSLFFGIAVQSYESGLISDQTPFDRFMEGDDAALTQAQLRGLLVFVQPGGATDPIFSGRGTGACITCHSGPELTRAGFNSQSPSNVHPGKVELEAETPILVDRNEEGVPIGGQQLITVPQRSRFQDNGFFNIGVRPTTEDIGRGGTAPDGEPLAFTRQAIAGLHGQTLPACPAPNEIPINPGEAPGPPVACPDGSPSNPRIGVDGAFKTPGLRNVELTGPYFHNGGQATLAQVADFYMRHGDFGDVNIANTEEDMADIKLGQGDLPDLVEFLVALTDDRVRNEKGPFDHPALQVFNGSPDTAGALGCVTGIRACDQIEDVPPTGSGGRPAAGLPPLGTFLNLDPRSR